MKFPSLTNEEALLCTLWMYIIYDTYIPYYKYSPLMLAVIFTFMYIGDKMGWITEGEVIEK